MIEVVRVLVYEYEDEDDMKMDMARWSVQSEGVTELGKRKITSMIKELPKRTLKEQRVLDVANKMVDARNRAAREGGDAVVDFREQEFRVDISGAIDTDLAPADAEPMTMPPVKDPYRPSTWLNPPALPEGLLDLDDDGNEVQEEA